MNLDENDTISRLQSASVRNALIAIVINLLTLVAVFTGKTFDIAVIQTYLENGYLLLVNLASVYFAYRAMHERIVAKKQITPLPWLEEIKSIKKEN